MDSGFANNGTFNPNLYYDANGVPTVDIALKPPVTGGSGQPGNDGTTSTGLGVGSHTQPEWLGQIAFFVIGFILLAVAMWAAVTDDN